MPKDPITRLDVEEFLRAFRTAIEFGPGVQLKPRAKNLEGLVKLGLTINGMKSVLSDLTVENYSSGPEPDDTDEKKEVWVFGYDLEGTELYIKLRLAAMPGKKHVFCPVVWSFHAAEGKLRYPLRQTGKRS